MTRMADDRIATLKTACHEAYKKHPKACNFSTMAVMMAMAARDGVRMTPPMPLLASDLVAWLDDPANGWTPVKPIPGATKNEHVVAASKAADQGYVVVAG